MGRARFMMFLFLVLVVSGVGCAPSPIVLGTQPPLQDRKELWSIGIAQGSSPLALSERVTPANPILTWRAFQQPDSAFVADPFLVSASGRWHLFFELFNTKNSRGEIGLATSLDLHTWTFQKVVLAEPFHLSYPFVLQEGETHFMIPESRAAGGIRLYRATKFPTEWVFERTLIEGAYSDASPVFFNGKWWLFAARAPYDLFIFYADSIRGPWKEHAKNPIYVADPSKARPGGRPVVVDGALVRFAQDNRDGYGRKVRALIVEELSATEFSERVAEPDPLFGPKGAHWSRNGMHHVAPTRAPDGAWIAAIDGNGDGFPE